MQSRIGIPQRMRESETFICICERFAFDEDRWLRSRTHEKPISDMRNQIYKFNT